jgi:hypothetical protein
MLPSRFLNAEPTTYTPVLAKASAANDLNNPKVNFLLEELVFKFIFIYCLLIL